MKRFASLPSLDPALGGLFQEATLFALPIPFAFGGDSRIAHRELAASAGARYVEREGPLSLDLDTPDDLIASGFERIEGIEAE